MVKHTQTIRQLQPTNCLNVFDHFVGLALNPFHATGFFRYPLKKSEPKVFCFQGVSKETNDMKWVKGLIINCVTSLSDKKERKDGRKMG